MGRDVQTALAEAAKLAHRIYPPLLAAGGLTAALRAAAVSVGVRARIEVDPGLRCPEEIVGAVYFCCLEVLEGADNGAGATISVRSEEGGVAFEVSANGGTRLPSVVAGRDRVEALGGWVTVVSDPGSRTHVSGSLPVSR